MKNPIISTDGKLQLVRKHSLAPVHFGEVVTDFRGEAAQIISAVAPVESHKAGYVYVGRQKEDGTFSNRSNQYYVTVFDLQWVDRREQAENSEEK